MSAWGLRREAAANRREAQRLLDIAVRLEAESGDLRRVFFPAWQAFVPTTWQGPAAGRAADGLADAQRRAHLAADRINVQALHLRRRSRDLRRRADDLDSRAAWLEREERLAVTRAALAAARLA